MRPVGRILPYHVLNISLHHLIQLPGRWMYPRFIAPYTAGGVVDNTSRVMG